MAAGPITRKIPFKELRTKLLRPALTSHFICDFKPPDSGFIGDRIDVSPTKLFDRLALGCSDAALPGSSLTTNDISDDFTGVSEKHAYRRLYDDSASFTFYVDADEYYVIRFFEAWIGYAMNEQYLDEQFIQSREYFYRAQWPNNYTVDTLSITKFERDYEIGEFGVLNVIPQKYFPRALQYNFVKAYPISIASMPVSYEQSQLLKCTVTFTYSRYWLKNLVGKLPQSRPNPNAPGVPELRVPSPPRIPNTQDNIPLPPPILNDYGTPNVPPPPPIPSIPGIPEVPAPPPLL